MAELDIEKLKSCTAIKQIPILTLDERWYHLITDKLKTDEICYWEKQVNELLKKQGQVNNDIKEVKKRISLFRMLLIICRMMIMILREQK